jgi:hypothetical protein
MIIKYRSLFARLPYVLEHREFVDVEAGDATALAFFCS